MKIVLILVTSISLIFFTFSDEDDLTTARELVKEFGTKLKNELMRGMKQGGPTEAIAVCYSEAPKIAEQLSDSTGWEIGRTSLMIRNLDNAPDNWEKTVLENFEKQLHDGKDIKTLEYSDIVKINGVEYFRYMKAIPTGSVCLSCHGSEIKAEVKEKISELYKDDKAVNFNKGDIRGAFTLSKKIN